MHTFDKFSSKKGLDSLMKRTIRIIIWLAIVGCISLFLLAAVGLSKLLSEPTWSLPEIDQALTVPIPNNASNLSYKGHPGRAAYLTLSFDAPPDSVKQFTNQFCDGILYASYDPFNAVNISEPYTFAHFIQLHDSTYYSYSPGTANTISGNRCLLTTSAQLQLRVTQKTAALQTVDLELLFACTLCETPKLNLLTPISDLPLYVLGFTSQNGAYLLQGPEMCVNIGLYTPDSQRKWSYLRGSQLQISLDKQLVASAFVADSGQLRQRRTRDISVDMQNSGNASYYCFEVQLPKGKHVLDLQISTPSGEIHANSWEFQIE
jgi:hypothetical protein